MAGQGGEGAQGAGGGGTTGGVGGAPPDNLDEILSQNNIVKMVEVDGIEFAETTADADGNVKFYSPNTNSVLANNAKDTLGAALPGTKIQAWSDGDVVTFHVVDPTGDIAPMLYSTDVPEPGANTVELTVDGEQLYYNGEDPTDISPLDADPYAFTIAGLQVSISIQSVAQSMLWTAAMSVLGHVVKGTCGFFNPLHQAECASLAKWVTKLAGFARPSFITKFLAAPVWETISVVGNEIATPLSNWICADVIGARLVGYLDPTDESAEAQAREVEVRKRIYEINYLVKKLEDAPPPNLSAVEARLDNSLGLAMSLRQLARKGNIIAEGHRLGLLEQVGHGPAQDRC